MSGRNLGEPKPYQEFGAATRPVGVAASIVGVICHPRSTFEAVVSRPRWLGLLVALTLVTAVARGFLLHTAVGRQALIDEWERTAEAVGAGIDEARYGQLRAWSTYGAAYGVASAVLAGPLLSLGVAAALWGAFQRAPRARSFRGLLSVVVHASAILAVRQTLAAPISYARETTASATSLAVWLPLAGGGALADGFLGVVDVFVMWWLVVLAVGLGVLLERPARRLAARFLGLYLAAAFALALALAVLGPAD